MRQRNFLNGVFHFSISTKSVEMKGKKSSKMTLIVYKVLLTTFINSFLMSLRNIKKISTINTLNLKKRTKRRIGGRRKEKIWKILIQNWKESFLLKNECMILMKGDILLLLLLILNKKQKKCFKISSQICFFGLKI